MITLDQHCHSSPKFFIGLIFNQAISHILHTSSTKWCLLFPKWHLLLEWCPMESITEGIQWICPMAFITRPCAFEANWVFSVLMIFIGRRWQINQFSFSKMISKIGCFSFLKVIFRKDKWTNRGEEVQRSRAQQNRKKSMGSLRG